MFFQIGFSERQEIGLLLIAPNGNCWIDFVMVPSHNIKEFYFRTNFARASSISVHELFTSQCNYSWAAKIFNYISIVIPDVAVNPHNLLRPGIPIRVKDFYTKRYDESWLLSINKNYDPNSQNKLKVYASIKNVFAVENYVLALPMMKRRHFTTTYKLASPRYWDREIYPPNDT